MVTIGPLTKATPAAVVALWVKLAGNCAARHVEPILYRAVDGGQLLGAFDDGDGGRLVGLRVSTLERRNEFQAHFIGVEPRLKRRGVGLQLSQAGKAGAIARGIRVMRARVDLLNADLVAIAIGRLGYTAKGFVNGNPHDCLITCNLPALDPAAVETGVAAGGDRAAVVAELVAELVAKPPAFLDDSEPARRAAMVVELPASATYAELKTALDPAFTAGLSVVGFSASDETLVYSLGVADGA